MLTPPLGEPIHWSFVVGRRSQVFFLEALHFEELDAVFGHCSCRPTLAAIKADGDDERSVEPDIDL